MKFWHMQIKEGEEDRRTWKEVKEIIKKHKVIGLDVWKEAAGNKADISLNEWTDKDFENYDKQATSLRQGKTSVFAKESLKTFCQKMDIGDIVLVRFGKKPICIARVKSKYFMSNYKDEKGEPWFRHRRKIDIIYEFDENAEDWPSPQKTLQLLVDDSSPSYLYLMRYFQEAMMQKILKHNKQIILYGPPGTGKTYRAKELAARILGLDPSSKEFEEKRFKPKNSPDGAWEIVQFHPSYNYEDFVRGISVTTTKEGQIKYEVKDRIFVEMCEEARNWCEKNCPHEDKNTKHKECPKDECAKYILIIDEINRANLAAVLGELIYALEYRGEAVRLPYEKKYDENKETTPKKNGTKLVVPPNLYIIGTMNTADRSIGHIDYAVRRRFAFVQVLPDKKVITKYYREKNLEKVGKVAEELFDEVEKIFKEDGCLSPDYHREDVQPGHSYFLAETADKLALKFAYQVWPLLKEYCKDGVLLCKNENCEIKIRGSFSLKEEVKPEELVEEINSLTSEETKESENEVPKESQKETPPAS